MDGEDSIVEVEDLFNCVLWIERKRYYYCFGYCCCYELLWYAKIVAIST